MDTIDVVLDSTTYPASDGVPEETVTYITLVLNGEKITNPFDPLEFALPHAKNANWFIMTCSCGIAGCAGYVYGTNVKRRAHTIEWRDGELKDTKRGRRTFPKRYYNFNRKEYELVQNKCMQLIRDVVTARELSEPTHERPDWRETRDSLIPWNSINKFEKCITRYQEYIVKNNGSWSW